MFIRKLIVSLTAALSLVLVQPAFSSTDSAIGTMAGILSHLSHYPSDAEKEKLAMIAKDNSASEHERVIATAIMNLQHKASSADKEKLGKIMNDASAPDNAKKLASIVYNLSHMPSDSDKETLKHLMQ